ncbi:MAG: sulfocyanin-like copper-binding protein [Solirubrobacteraceae bacterium]
MRQSKYLIAAAALAVAAGAGAVGVGLAGSPSGASVSGNRASHSASSAGRGDGEPTMGSTGGMTGSSEATMGGGAGIHGGSAGGLVPAGRMEALAAKAARSAQVIGATVTYPRRQVTLVALGAPGNRPGMYWQIDGLDGPGGPTVSVAEASTITVDFADGDPGHPHGFELTTAAPPYPRMAMMAGRIAAPGALIMPVPAPKGRLWHAATVTFRAPPPGTYYYICPVPGHAAQGMWGKLVVRPAATH